MKKFTSTIIAVMFSLVMVASVQADTVHVDGGDGIGIVYNHGDTNDGGWATGTTNNSYEADAYGYNNAGALGVSGSAGEVEGTNADLYGGMVGVSASESYVESAALTIAGPIATSHSTVGGYAAQANWANAQAGSNAAVVAGNTSGAAYNGTDFGYNLSGVAGDATTQGVTLTGAHSTGDTSLAGGLTGNSAESNLYNADTGRATVHGAGGLTSATYASGVSGPSGGSAGTLSNSGFTYGASGHNHAEGSGLAVNGGVSSVVAAPDSVSAVSASGGVAFSQSDSN